MPFIMPDTSRAVASDLRRLLGPEGVKGDGIGEWVECELTRPATGFLVQNGFSMSLTPIKGKDIDGYYA